MGPETLFLPSSHGIPMPLAHNLTLRRKVTGSSQGQAGVTQILSVGLRCKETPRRTIGCSRARLPRVAVQVVHRASRNALMKPSPVLLMKPRTSELVALPGERSTFFSAPWVSLLIKLCTCREGSTLKGHLFLILHTGTVVACPQTPGGHSVPTSASPCSSSLSPVSQFLLQSMEVQGEENSSVSHLCLQTQSLSSVTTAPPGCEEWAWGFLSPRSLSCLLPPPCPESSAGGVRLSQPLSPSWGGGQSLLQGGVILRKETEQPQQTKPIVPTAACVHTHSPHFPPQHVHTHTHTPNSVFLPGPLLIATKAELNGSH